MDLFTTIRVQELEPRDFYLGSETPTMLRERGCVLVLFYLPRNRTSQELGEIWARLADELASPSFRAVNGARQREIMAAFTETGANPDHPLYPFSVRGYPTIIVYRAGWPQAFYNGPKSYEALLEYATTLACQPGYYEPTNDFIGVEPSEEGGGLEAYEGRRGAEAVEYPMTSRGFPAPFTASYLEDVREPEYPESSFVPESPLPLREFESSEEVY